MEENTKPSKGKGRPKGSKSISVIAFNKETLDFAGVFPNPNKAAMILFENSLLSPLIRNCLQGKCISTKGYVFFEFDMSGGLTSEIIKEYREKARLMIKIIKRITFTAKMLKKMEDDHLDQLKALYDKYNN